MHDQDRLPPIHPGEVLREEFVRPMRLTAYAVAKAISVPAPRIYDILKEKRGITADTALRLARFFGTTAEFWMGLQAQFDLENESDRLAGVLELEVTPWSATG